MSNNLNEKLQQYYKEGNYEKYRKNGGDIEKAYKDFRGKFGKEAIKNLSSAEVLKVLFGNKDDDALGYNLEKQTRYFGGIGIGGSWQRILSKRDGVWRFGRSETLSEERAEQLAKEYRKKFVDLFDLIDGLILKDGLRSSEDYKAIEQKGWDDFGSVCRRQWFLKYLAMLYPQYFMNAFKDGDGDRSWVSYVFRKLGLPKDPSWYINCWTFTRFANEQNIPNLVLYKIAERLYWKDLGSQDGAASQANGDDAGDRVTGGRNVILYGVPGCGKSYHADNIETEEDKKERIVFHPDYSYSDFVGQILPSVDGDGVRYRFTPGPFTRILKEAIEDQSTQYCLIIEEINRGNAPAIFGDIFQLLDRNEDGTSAYGIVNADIAQEVYGDKNHEVRIPSNLSIIATMNTSDQNVFVLDTAFQRRWEMRLVPNVLKDGELASSEIAHTGVTWKKFFMVINECFLDSNLGMASNEDKRLGAYFVCKKDLTEPDRFAEKVLKYLWDDAFKFNRGKLFASGFNSLEKVVEKFCHSKEDERFDVFNADVKDALYKGKEPAKEQNEGTLAQGHMQEFDGQ